MRQLTRKTTCFSRSVWMKYVRWAVMPRMAEMRDVGRRGGVIVLFLVG